MQANRKLGTWTSVENIIGTILMSKRLFTKLATHSGHEVVVFRFHVFVSANEAWVSKLLVKFDYLERLSHRPFGVDANKSKSCHTGNYNGLS